MTQHDLGQAKDKDIAHSMAAMKRAATMARATAVQTSTAIIVVQRDHIVRLTANDLRKQGHA